MQKCHFGYAVLLKSSEEYSKQSLRYFVVNPWEIPDGFSWGIMWRYLSKRKEICMRNSWRMPWWIPTGISVGIFGRIFGRISEVFAVEISGGLWLNYFLVNFSKEPLYWNTRKSSRKYLLFPGKMIFEKFFEVSLKWILEKFLRVSLEKFQEKCLEDPL